MHPHGSIYNSVFKYGDTSYNSCPSLKKPSTTVIGMLQQCYFLHSFVRALWRKQRILFTN